MNSDLNGMTPADFRETAQAAVAACAGKTLAEQAAHLANDGLLGICVPEAAGGLGLPVAFALPIVEAAGGGLLRFPLIETILVGMAFAGDADTAAPVVSGRNVVTIAWKGTAEATDAADGGLILSGAVGSAPFGADCSLFLVRLADGRGALIAGDGISAVDQPSLDLIRPEATLRLDAVAVEAGRIVPTETMAELDATALLLRSALMVGSAAQCVALATEHASTRKQFGKLLIANQAVRHSLARQKLALESARAVTERAASETRGPLTDRSAYAIASAGSIAVAESAVQILGGMGFTWEVPLHYHLRQMRTLDEQAEGAANLDRLAGAFIASVATAAEGARA